MTCRELCDFLMEYLEGRLPMPGRQRFEQHIADCDECEAYLSSYQAAVRMGKSLCRRPDEPVPGDVPQRLIEAIVAAARASSEFVEFVVPPSGGTPKNECA